MSYVVGTLLKKSALGRTRREEVGGNKIGKETANTKGEGGRRYSLQGA